VPHLRPVHALRLHPRPGVLRPPSGLQGEVSPGGEGARQRGGQPPLRGQRGQGTCSNGQSNFGARRYKESDVLRLRSLSVLVNILHLVPGATAQEAAEIL